MENMIDSVGSSTLHAMGTAYAASCDEKAGLDVEHIQKNYLWSEGGKMAAMSLLMLAVAVAVSYTHLPVQAVIIAVVITFIVTCAITWFVANAYQKKQTASKLSLIHI